MISSATASDVHLLDFVSHSEAQTRRLGKRLGRLLRPGDVLLFVGEFGAGKTTFIQGIAEGLGVEGSVASPSFTLVWEYVTGDMCGRVPFYHIDLYRLSRLEETQEIGLENYLYSDGVCAVEWADRVPEAMPEEHLQVELTYLSETKRVVRIGPAGERYVALLEEFKRSAFGS